MVFERIWSRLPGASKNKKKERPEKIEVKKVSPAEKLVEKPRAVESKAKGIESALILTSPHVTEKSTQLSGDDQYVFKVFSKANKIEIKKAIESLYGVKVIGVRIINVPAKQRRLGKTQGWKKGYKKATIKIKAGQKIEAITV